MAARIPCAKGKARSDSRFRLGMGFVGGLLPAFHAARMKVVDALRRA